MVVHPPKAPQVTTATVQARDTAKGGRTLLNASGYVTTRREATVSSKVTGKVMEVLVEEGMQVAEDQVLARLDASNIETGLRAGRGAIDARANSSARDRAAGEQAEAEAAAPAAAENPRLRVPPNKPRRARKPPCMKARLERQQADVTVAERQVDVWQQQMDDTIIRAPFAGIVTTKNAQPGEMISPMSAGGGFTRTGICTIVDMDSLEIEIDVNESYINRVEPGQPVEATLDAYPDWKIPCKVIAIIPTADRQKSTVKVRVGFDKLDPRILPEMGVKVAFRESGEAAPRPAARSTVPKSAVRQQDGRDVVLGRPATAGPNAGR